MPRRCLVDSTRQRVRGHPEPAAVVEHRRRLLGRARGRVLDLSLHPEANRQRLTDGATGEVTVVAGGRGPSELWDATLPGDAPVAGVRLVTGSLHADAFEAGSLDTVVSVMTLCTLDDPEAVLAAACRWLASDGQLLVLEHVRATGLTALAQSAATPVERLLLGGCRLDVDMSGACRRAGFDLTDGARFTARVAGGVPVPFFAGVGRPRSRHLTEELAPT